MLLLAMSVPFTSANDSPIWKRLAPLPDELGVAGAFAGVSGGALLVAGGANFPGEMPWNGGKKVWRDTVFVLEQPEGKWRRAGKLPRPLAYGVSVSHRDSIVCVGGGDAQRHYAESFRLRWRGGNLITEPLPALPITLANMSGALAGDILYIAGGTEKPGELWATNRFFAIDLGARHLGWSELDPVPGQPRLLATAATHDGDFYLFGGAALVANADGRITRNYLREALRYRPRGGWSRLADLPKPCVAAPAPAQRAIGRFLLIGGDDGARIGFAPPERHPGFATSILAYDPMRDHWSDFGKVPAPRATVPCVEWRGMFVMPSGEVHPGVRSPEVWAVVVNETETRGSGDVKK